MQIEYKTRRYKKLQRTKRRKKPMKNTTIQPMKSTTLDTTKAIKIKAENFVLLLYNLFYDNKKQHMKNHGSSS